MIFINTDLEVVKFTNNVLISILLVVSVVYCSGMASHFAEHVVYSVHGLKYTVEI